MGKIALMFAGQGAQYSGMGKEIYDASPAAKELFDLFETVRPDTKRQCFLGTAEELAITVNTQPTVFAVDLACAYALREAGVCADAVAGFSLGEVAAYAFAGKASAEDAFRLVCKRAEFMQECTETTKGGMVAALKLTPDVVEAVAAKFNQVYPVNYNCPGQVSVAGAAEEMDAFADAITEAGGRSIKLAVSGAFHTPFMAPASEKLGEEIAKLPARNETIPIYANVTGQPYGEPDLLAKQVMNPVRWQDTIEHLIADGFDTFIEVGPGKTLSGFMRKINKEVKSYHVEDAATLAETVKEIVHA